MTYLPPIVQILLITVAAVAGFFDFRQRRVPNWLALSGLLLGFALNGFLYEGDGFWMSLKGLGLASLIYFPLYLLRAMGAGDVKLMGAIGAIVGPANWLGIMILTALAGGAVALALVVTKGRVRHTARNMGLILVSLMHRTAPYQASSELDVGSGQGMRLPHAVMIMVGAMSFLIAAAIWAPH